MSRYEQFLVQANEHLRAIDSKRNEIFYFFIILFGVYLTFYKDIFDDEILSKIITFFLILLGTIIIFVIIRYQVWHTIYVNTAIILQKIINYEEKGPITETELNNYFNKKDKFYSIAGTEFFIYNSFLIINFSIIVLLIYQLEKEFFTQPRAFIMIAFGFIVYVVGFNLIRLIFLAKAKLKFLGQSWILKMYL